MSGLGAWSSDPPRNVQPETRNTQPDSVRGDAPREATEAPTNFPEVRKVLDYGRNLDADALSDDVAALRGICYFAFDRMPDSQVFEDAADAVDSLCALLAVRAGQATGGPPDETLRSAAMRYGAAMHKAGQEDVRRSPYYERAHDLVAEATKQLETALGQPAAPAPPDGFVALIAAELAKARAKHHGIKSLHEGYAVVLEEMDELWDEVRSQNVDRTKVLKELVQVATMCQRFAEDTGLVDFGGAPAPSEGLADEWWLEFVNKQLCGLCGNTGYVDTRGKAVSAAGTECGVRRPCICPNGRARLRAGHGREAPQ